MFPCSRCKYNIHLFVFLVDFQSDIGTYRYTHKCHLCKGTSPESRIVRKSFMIMSARVCPHCLLKEKDQQIYNFVLLQVFQPFQVLFTYLIFIHETFNFPVRNCSILFHLISICIQPGEIRTYLYIIITAT